MVAAVACKDRGENITETCWLVWYVIMIRTVFDTLWVTAGTERVKVPQELNTENSRGFHPQKMLVTLSQSCHYFKTDPCF